jgi:hypothetical protein
MNLHPSQYQINNGDNLKQNRTLLSVTQERENRLFINDIKKLESPGKYNFTIDDKTLRGTNTNSLFKNLYGETPLTFLFFSKQNVDNIQKLIRMLVNKHTGQTIDNQSNTELLIVMRSIFLEYSRHPKLIDESMSEDVKKKLIIQYTLEVDRLNKLVVDNTVPSIVSQLQQYLMYLDDASSPLRVMDKPLSTSVKGTKSYRSSTQVLLGGDL